MEKEVESLLNTVIATTISLSYARLASSLTNPGKIRLLVLVPVIIILSFLPWQFSSTNLRAITAFFFSCYAPFKLLLLSFGLGPLSPSLPLPAFISVSFLPVKLRSAKSSSGFPLVLALVSKLIIILSVKFLYDNHYMLGLIRKFHLFLILDLGVTLPTTLSSILLGLEAEQMHDEPHKSESLRDFWGRRWNLVIASITRPAIFLPIHSRCGPTVAVMATFFVSGVMHEYMFYCITLVKPTGDVLCFFLLHGLCTLGEVMVKRKWGKVVAGPVAVGFVVASAMWLFFPGMVRGGAGEKSVEEMAAAMRYLGSWRKNEGSVAFDDVFM